LDDEKIAFPLDFAAIDDSDQATCHQPPELQDQSEKFPSLHAAPDGKPTSVQRLMEPGMAFPEQEREVYQNMLPSFHAVKAVRSVATTVLQGLQETSGGHVEDSSARALLCRRMLDMCDEVTRAQGAEECPETEPGGGTLTAALRSMHQACPILDITRHGASLIDEVLRCADSDPSVVTVLIQAVAGVEALQDAGVSPSAVSLHACCREVQRAGNDNNASTLAALAPWLNPTDAFELLSVVVEKDDIDSSKRMEAVGHLREVWSMHQEHASSLESPPRNENAGKVMNWQLFGDLLEQAEELLLLRSVYAARCGDRQHLSLRMSVGKSLAELRSEWLCLLRANEEYADFAPCAEAVLRYKA